MTTASLSPRPYRTPASARAAAAAEALPASKGAWTRQWTYFTIVFAFWCFTPLLRRLLDWHRGFYSPIQITSLIPYVLMIPIAFYALRRERLARISPAFKLFAGVWIATFSYGFLVSAFTGNLSAGAFEAVQYIFPMLAGIWLAGEDIQDRRLITQLSMVALVFGGIVALYGCAQFVNPPPWDVLWVTGGGFESVGNPAPFQIRVFSTLNQAGPAADFFVAVIILTLPSISLKRVWIWPFLSMLGAALLLTLVRTSWIGLVLGVIVYIIVSPRRLRALPFIGIYIALLAFLVASLPAFLGASSQSDVVSARIATLGDVDHDSSALARSTEIADAFNQGLENPIGQGLGMLGASSALSANPTTPAGNNLDSGYMARFLELGWAGFGGYLFVVIGSLATLVGSAFRRTDKKSKPADMVVLIATAAAMCAALVWGDAAGDSHLGLDGLIFWIAMGIGFRRSGSEPEPSAETPAPPKRGIQIVSMRGAVG
jgi:putative inorganic carbon (HCO3(-)) transporter